MTYIVKKHISDVILPSCIIVQGSNVFHQQEATIINCANKDHWCEWITLPQTSTRSVIEIDKS